VGRGDRSLGAADGGELHHETGAVVLAEAKAVAGDGRGVRWNREALARLTLGGSLTEESAG